MAPVYLRLVRSSQVVQWFTSAWKLSVGLTCPGATVHANFLGAQPQPRRVDNGKLQELRCLRQDSCMSNVKQQEQSFQVTAFSLDALGRGLAKPDLKLEGNCSLHVAKQTPESQAGAGVTPSPLSSGPWACSCMEMQKHMPRPRLGNYPIHLSRVCASSKSSISWESWVWPSKFA